MKNLKNYSANGIDYTYSLQAQGWVFKVVAANFTLIRHFRGGAEKAHKIARILAGSFKRAGHLDGMGRYAIERVERVN